MPWSDDTDANRETTMADLLDKAIDIAKKLRKLAKKSTDPDIQSLITDLNLNLADLKVQTVEQREAQQGGQQGTQSQQGPQQGQQGQPHQQQQHAPQPAGSPRPGTRTPGQDDDFLPY